MQGVGAVIGVGVVACAIMVVGGGGGTAIVNPLMPMHSPSFTASMDVHSEDAVCAPTFGKHTLMYAIQRSIQVRKIAPVLVSAFPDCTQYML